MRRDFKRARHYLREAFHEGGESIPYPDVTDSGKGDPVRAYIRATLDEKSVYFPQFTHYLVFGTARLLMAEGKKELAAEFLWFLHSLTDFCSLDAATNQWLDDLRQELPPDVFDAARERGQSFDLVTGLALLYQFTVDPAPEESERTRRPVSPTDTLTEREREVLRLVAEGLSNREIAQELVVTLGTVKKHLNNLFSKMNVRSRTQAILKARESHLSGTINPQNSTLVD